MRKKKMIKIIVSSQKTKKFNKTKKETIFSSVVNPKRKEIPLSLKNQNPFQVIEGSHLIIFTKKEKPKKSERLFAPSNTVGRSKTPHSCRPLTRPKKTKFTWVPSDKKKGDCWLDWLNVGSFLNLRPSHGIYQNKKV